MFAEGVYLLVYNNASYRKNINRRLKVMSDKSDRESVLVQLRRERGLTSSGEYRLPIVSLNRLLLQSGLTMGFGRLILVIVVAATAAFTGVFIFKGSALYAFLAALFCGVVTPPFVLKYMRGRRRKIQRAIPDGIDIIVRSLRRLHPVPIAISMVSKEMTDRLARNSALCRMSSPYGPISKATAQSVLS
jgi:tight adherence protein B